MPIGLVAVRGGGSLAIRAASGLLALAVATGGAAAQPVIIEEVLRQTSGGAVRGLMATVDLTDPSVEIVVSSGNGTAGQTTLQTTPAFRTANSCKVAINANYFGTVNATTASVIGLCVTNGAVVSPARQFGAEPDPALTFTASRLAAIGNISSTVGVWDAVAGVGPSNTDSDPGTMLITDGVNTGATARVTPSTREPRTAVGVNQAGTRLYMLVIDGRQTGWSVGMTLPELGELLLEKGVWRAVNLDGGGSSAFSYVTDTGAVANNRPSDGSARAVAVNLGIKLNPPATVTDRVSRPMRGVWMRPPSTIAGFESNLATLATCGIQDVFLETFYWGLATNSSSVYNDRFGFDYLAQAINAAAKYGMRVHAWCETGYQGFGTTGDYLLSPTGVGDQNGRIGNPEWRILNISDSTIFGDGTAGQMFVNLIHPGVRARISEYLGELANYPGLEGIQIDYTRFPLDNNTGDVHPAPWSYDTWTRGAFQTAGFGDPVNTAARSSGPNSSEWNQFVTWRRGGITDTVYAMVQAIREVNTGVTFSGAVFPSPLNTAQLTKMQDWPSWSTGYALPVVIPMCYSSTQSSITTEVNSAISNAGFRRVAVGLAYPGTTGHPSVPVQLAAITGASRRIEEFVWFDTTSFVSASNAATNRTDLNTWINNTAAKLQGDVSAGGTSNGFNGFIDARDLNWFNSVFTGTPVPRTAANDRCDLNRDGTINATDKAMLERQWRLFHFGEDGVVDARDVQACINAFTPGPAPIAGILNLWDLNGDGAVNYLDQMIVHANLTAPMGPDLDVNSDGAVNVLDVYAYFTGGGRDVNRDGVISAADLVLLLPAVRGGEVNDTTSGRR